MLIIFVCQWSLNVNYICLQIMPVGPCFLYLKGVLYDNDALSVCKWFMYLNDVRMPLMSVYEGCLVNDARLTMMFVCEWWLYPNDSHISMMYWCQRCFDVNGDCMSMLYGCQIIFVCQRLLGQWCPHVKIIRMTMMSACQW